MLTPGIMLSTGPCSSVLVLVLVLVLEPLVPVLDPPLVPPELDEVPEVLFSKVSWVAMMHCARLQLAASSTRPRTFI